MSTEIEIEFARAKANGWLPAFKGEIYYGFSAALMMAIASRETNMQNEEGDIQADGPHGFCLVQIDKGTDAQFCLSGAWKSVAACLQRGAAILHAKQIEIEQGLGKRLTVESGGKAYTFTGAQLSATDLNRTTIAAYNAGLWAYYGMSVHGNPDIYTTGHNYSADVIARTQEFEKLLAGG